MNIKRTVKFNQSSVWKCSVVCAVVISIVACGDGDDTGLNPPGAPDSGAQGNGGNGNGGNAGSGNEDDGGAGAGNDAALPCVIDTAAAANGCGGETIEIEGEYTDDFGGTVTIAECSIFGSPVTELSNDDQYMVTQNSCADLFFPGKWSRHDWTWFAADGGAPALYICTEVYDADSEAAALAAPRADDTDPTTGGCGGTFAWTKLTPIVVSDGGAPDAAVSPDAAADAASPIDAAVPTDAAADAGDGG